jgi:transcription-repair coupling factor (superfamily II helicase)
VKHKPSPRGNAKAPYKVTCEDDTARIDLVFFHAEPSFIQKQLPVGEVRYVSGRSAGIAKVDAGPKGAVITLHKGRFANPEGLIAFVQGSRGALKVQPDQRLVYRADWDLPEVRLKGVRTLVQQFADIANKTKRAA